MPGDLRSTATAKVIKQYENKRRRAIFYFKRGGNYPKSALATLPQFNPVRTTSTSFDIRNRLGAQVDIRERLGPVVESPVLTPQQEKHHLFNSRINTSSKISSLCVNSTITQSKLNIKLCERLSSLEASLHFYFNNGGTSSTTTRNHPHQSHSPSMDNADDDQVDRYGH